MNRCIWFPLAKRGFDVVAASLGLIFFSPLILIVAIAVRVTMGRPVLFRQFRPGRLGNTFCLLKFRTMDNSRNCNGLLRSDAERLTRLGTLLRRTSLDELPQLWNVLRGEMSLVGPRPLLVEYVSNYTPTQARRHEVRPGITGLAQVQGRQAIPFSKRLEYDVWYVENQALSLDLWILCMTVLRVFRAEGIKPGQEVFEVDDLGLSSSQDRSSEESWRRVA